MQNEKPKCFKLILKDNTILYGLVAERTNSHIVFKTGSGNSYIFQLNQIELLKPTNVLFKMRGGNNEF